VHKQEQFYKECNSHCYPDSVLIENFNRLNLLVYVTESARIPHISASLILQLNTMGEILNFKK